VTVLLGGARSGKSSTALRLAAEHNLPVVFIATATAGDDDMETRIKRHQAERPKDWSTIEEPLDLAMAITRTPAEAVVIVDCLTLWVTNLLMLNRTEDEIVDAARRAVDVLVGRTGHSIVVTNEVGLGLVPTTQLGRTFRDALGRVNTLFVAPATTALFLVAGRTLRLE
jgi:adenosylcobinamide kinase / adenosylcobinamide-phosphate guanylyltransferase